MFDTFRIHHEEQDFNNQEQLNALRPSEPCYPEAAAPQTSYREARDRATLPRMDARRTRY